MSALHTTRVLCCLDGTNIEQISNALTSFITIDTPVIGLLYVIDQGPHGEVERTRERFMRPSGPLSPRQDQMKQIDDATAQDILNEGLRYLPNAELVRKAGRPEREIVNFAAEWNADVIVICPRSHYGGKVEIGPRSVGHVARFVLDHAPCPVLLVRPFAREQFPIKR